MNKIFMVTERKIDGSDASGNRAEWEFNALKKQGFTDIELVDEFDNTKISKVSKNLIHAQQLSGRLLENCRYIVDAHGLEHVFSSHMFRGYPFHSWRKWAFLAKSYHYKKLETKIFRNSQHVICAGEHILEKVKNIQSATLVRNAVFPENYIPTKCTSLKIALVGPFLPGKLNYFGFDMIQFLVKKFENIEFVFIGSTDQYFRDGLKFKNTTFTGKVDNYIEILRTCSVLLAPYPDYAYYLGSKTKFIEAAACQMPIITTPVGNVDFQNDHVCIGKTKNELANQINYLKDESVRVDLGKKLRNEILKNYNAEIEIKKVIKLYNELI
jgi:glycosyltransferase involved in cell wall biosynthesis